MLKSFCGHVIKPESFLFLSRKTKKKTTDRNNIESQLDLVSCTSKFELIAEFIAMFEEFIFFLNIFFLLQLMLALNTLVRFIVFWNLFAA